MPWIVTSWRGESEREARRVARAIARELADADAYLEALERFGADTRGDVRRQRVALRTDGPGAPVEVHADMTRKPARARMRDSPLTELFRATAGR